MRRPRAAERVVPLSELGHQRQRTWNQLERVGELIADWDAYERSEDPTAEPPGLVRSSLVSLRDMLVELLAELDTQLAAADLAGRRN